MFSNVSASPNGTHLESAKPDPRSRLNMAMKSVTTWDKEDQRFFAAAFMSRKTKEQIAADLGMSSSSFEETKKAMVRRFMQAAQHPA